MQEKVIMKFDVIQHLGNVKNMNIKSYLNLLDKVDISDSDKKLLREMFLDSINGYYRETKRVFSSVFSNE